MKKLPHECLQTELSNSVYHATKAYTQTQRQNRSAFRVQPELYPVKRLIAANLVSLVAFPIKVVPDSAHHVRMENLQTRLVRLCAVHAIRDSLQQTKARQSVRSVLQEPTLDRKERKCARHAQQELMQVLKEKQSV